MDPTDAFSANMFRWDPRAAAGPPPGVSNPCPPPAPLASLASSQHHHHHNSHEIQPPPPPATAPDNARELEDVFEGYGVRYSTMARIGDLGFTASTLVGMREEEVDDMMATLSHLFRWDLLVGERYGIKAAIRAERRRLESLIFAPASAAHPLNHHQQQMGYLFSSAAGHHHLLPDDPRRRLMLLSPENHNALDALSQEGLSEEPVQLDREAAGSGGEIAGKRDGKGKNPQRRTPAKKKEPSLTKSKKKKKKGTLEDEEEDDDDDETEMWARSAGNDEEDDDGEESQSERGGAGERQREHPFIVTEPGEVARAKKNGLDYLFHLYEQCHDFLLQVQAVAKERGDKCPTKVTNLVFRYAKKVGASYINKPKMRHYVHCYALHVLDEDASNALRRAFKERGENVGAWRLACYKPLVSISAAHAFDIDAVFNAHPRLSIWYVPTKLRQLCHLARSSAASQLPSVHVPRTGGSSHNRVPASVNLVGHDSAAAAAAAHSLRPPMF